MEANILVVDDEPEIADLVGVYLKSEGFTVFTCGTAAEALACVRAQSLDLAVLDVMLPDMSGFVLCGEIRKEYHFPVIMLTAKGYHQALQSAGAGGAGQGAASEIHPL